ncbi:hypothetical protein LMH87_010771 [Akanthomyces muscarius]|uniref:Uncharacterized protein n=1 Tax=Akanthomyces muscarius TaxID=2231603 RepID=A0A9W8QA01_AKAMU|nr:hypothetical protein LMH87_010771 [Akanthomyces muscarius]KAJ4150002.1 hypothetical protein LMH87_010771 [Akanthomyces muscarius]
MHGDGNGRAELNELCIHDDKCKMNDGNIGRLKQKRSSKWQIDKTDALSVVYSANLQPAVRASTVLVYPASPVALSDLPDVAHLMHARDETDIGLHCATT